MWAPPVRKGKATAANRSDLAQRPLTHPTVQSDGPQNQEIEQAAPCTPRLSWSLANIPIFPTDRARRSGPKSLLSAASSSVWTRPTLATGAIDDSVEREADPQVKPASPAANSFMVQRKCACGADTSSGECEGCRENKLLGIQTKLRISEPGDAYEQEADRVADEVMRMPEPANGSEIQKASPNFVVQRRTPNASSAIAEAPPIVQEVLSSPGQPLDAATRGFFEPRFGYDFGSVRVHADQKASTSANATKARAYTFDNHIVLGKGEHATQADGDRKLIAHELVHVIQQNKGYSEIYGRKAVSVVRSQSSIKIVSDSGKVIARALPLQGAIVEKGTLDEKLLPDPGLFDRWLSDLNEIYREAVQSHYTGGELKTPNVFDGTPKLAGFEADRIRNESRDNSWYAWLTSTSRSIKLEGSKADEQWKIYEVKIRSEVANGIDPEQAVRDLYRETAQAIPESYRDAETGRQRSAGGSESDYSWGWEGDVPSQINRERRLISSGEQTAGYLLTPAALLNPPQSEREVDEVLNAVQAADELATVAFGAKGALAEKFPLPEVAPQVEIAVEEPLRDPAAELPPAQGATPPRMAGTPPETPAASTAEPLEEEKTGAESTAARDKGTPGSTPPAGSVGSIRSERIAFERRVPTAADVAVRAVGSDVIRSEGKTPTRREAPPTPSVPPVVAAARASRDEPQPSTMGDLGYDVGRSEGPPGTRKFATAGDAPGQATERNWLPKEVTPPTDLSASPDKSWQSMPAPINLTVSGPSPVSTTVTGLDAGQVAAADPTIWTLPASSTPSVTADLDVPPLSSRFPNPIAQAALALPTRDPSTQEELRKYTQIRYEAYQLEQQLKKQQGNITKLSSDLADAHVQLDRRIRQIPKRRGLLDEAHCFPELPDKGTVYIPKAPGETDEEAYANAVANLLVANQAMLDANRRPRLVWIEGQNTTTDRIDELHILQLYETLLVAYIKDNVVPRTNIGDLKKQLEEKRKELEPYEKTFGRGYFEDPRLHDIILDPRNPDPKAGKSYGTTAGHDKTHLSGFRAEILLANWITAQKGIVVSYGDPIGTNYADVISVDNWGDVTLWDSKYHSDGRTEDQSGTFSDPGACKRAINDAIAQITTSRLDEQLKEKAIENLNKGDFVARTVSSTGGGVLFPQITRDVAWKFNANVVTEQFDR